MCLYDVENSREDNPEGILNKGLFDIFREDLIDEDMEEVLNRFAEVWL